MASEIKVDTIVNAGGDNDSGIDLSTNDKIGMKIANSEVVTVDTTGVVFNENSADRDFRVESDASTHGLFLEGSTSKVGVGTSSPDGALHIKGISDHGRLILENGGTAGNNNTIFMQFHVDNGTEIAQIEVAEGATNEGQIIFKTGGTTERLKITHNGSIYASSADTSLSNLTLRKNAGDAIDYLQCRKTDNDLRIVLEGSGDVHNATGTFSAISDEKLKENIVDASSQWDDIKNIKIRNFSLKADKSSKPNMIGVVAQEIEKVSPNLVKERIDTDPDTGEDLGTKTKIVKYSILHTKAVKALQEAMERIETLEAKVTALEGK